MPGVTEMGMVWMGASQPSQEMPIGIMTGDNSDMLMDHDNIYYTSSNHSMSNQSIDDMHTVQTSQIVSIYKMFTIFSQIHYQYLRIQWKTTT